MTKLKPCQLCGNIVNAWCLKCWMEAIHTNMKDLKVEGCSISYIWDTEHYE